MKSFWDIPNIEERIIVKNDLAFAFPTNIPIVPGHTLISPIRVVATFEELTNDEVAAIFDLMKKLKIAMKKTFEAEGFNTAWNEGVIGGQSVPHFHLHLLPRKEGDTGIYEYEPRKFLYRTGGGRPESPEEELQQVAQLLRSAL